ncbi:MAG: sigma-70 family RNA polymerase sigma factor [Myxococcales bacterium]|nr:sigma-70 family RNA polymerase sigma factor [Myxococcales bacterium]
MSEGLSNREVADLYRRYGFFLRRRCLVLLRNSSLADDAFQETFMKLMRAGAPLRTADEPLRWLYRVADRTCFDLLRKTKNTRRSSSIDEMPEELPAHPGVEPEMRRAAIELLDALDDEDQRIAVMAFVDGMNQQEIADELGYSRMTIIKRMARLRERAQRVLADRPRLVAPRHGGPS